VLLPSGKVLCVFNETDYHWSVEFSRITLLESIDYAKSWGNPHIIDEAMKLPTLFYSARNKVAVFSEMNRGLIEGNEDVVVEPVEKALDDNTPAKGILDKGIIPGLRQVGDLFEKGEYFLPELIVSGEAATRALELLQPILEKSGTGDSYSHEWASSLPICPPSQKVSCTSTTGGERQSSGLRKVSMH